MFVCVWLFVCVFACAGNGARLALELAHGADGRSRRPAAAGASAPSSSLRCTSASLWPATAAPCGSPAVRAGQRRAPAAAERSCATIPACRRGSATVLRSAIDRPARAARASLGSRAERVRVICDWPRPCARACARRDRAGCARSLQPRACSVQRTSPDLHTGRSRSFRCSACRAASRAGVVPPHARPALPAQRRGRVQRCRAAGSCVVPALSPRQTTWAWA